MHQIRGPNQRLTEENMHQIRGPNQRLTEENMHQIRGPTRGVQRITCTRTAPLQWLLAITCTKTGAQTVADRGYHAPKQGLHLKLTEDTLHQNRGSTSG
jgi:hypothetical protein